MTRHVDLILAAVGAGCTLAGLVMLFGPGAALLALGLLLIALATVV